MIDAFPPGHDAVTPPVNRKLAERIRKLAKAGDIVMFQRGYYEGRLALHWMLGFLVGVGLASLFWVLMFWGIAKAQAQTFIGQPGPTNVTIMAGGKQSTLATLTLMADGRLLWNGREVKTDAELREAVIVLARELQCSGRK